MALSAAGHCFVSTQPCASWYHYHSWTRRRSCLPCSRCQYRRPIVALNPQLVITYVISAASMFPLLRLSFLGSERNPIHRLRCHYFTPSVTLSAQLVLTSLWCHLRAAAVTTVVLGRRNLVPFIVLSHYRTQTVALSTAGHSFVFGAIYVPKLPPLSSSARKTGPIHRLRCHYRTPPVALSA